MAEHKTKATELSVEGYLSAMKDDARRKDCEALAKLMTKATSIPRSSSNSSSAPSRRGSGSMAEAEAAPSQSLMPADRV